MNEKLVSDKPNKPSKTAVNYGLLFGIIMILEFVISYSFNIDPQENKLFGTIINIMNYIILPFMFIYFAANKYKLSFNNGFISLSETLKTGTLVCALAALIYAVFDIIFDFIDPAFKDKMFEKIKDVTDRVNPNLTSKQSKTSLEFVKMFMSPYVMLPFTIIMYSLIGIIHSLIVGVIIKKDKPIFE